jgi:hypothetical protein
MKTSRERTRVLTRDEVKIASTQPDGRKGRRTRERNARQRKWKPKATWTWTWGREGSILGASLVESGSQTERRDLTLGVTERKRKGEPRALAKEEIQAQVIEDRGERRKGVRKQRRTSGPSSAGSKEEKGSPGKAGGESTWSEAVVRVGTGYRVRKSEADPRQRRFDVGYADRKVYTRKEGREAKVEGSNMGRTVSGNGPHARVKVMNAVGDREKRRRVSEYTGSGIRRKSRVGKRKLKPTKAQTKA